MTTLTLEEVRSIVYALQRAVASYQPGQLDDPTSLRTAFGAYTEAIEAINQRLRSAHAILRQGRRAEALHACEADPNLLDCVQELDSSDQLATEWAPTLEELGIERPEPLLGDLALELGAAYDSKHQLANLTRLLRLLAIGRGPLEERVKVLRRIALLDTENPAWLDDLRVHEDRCIRELRAELDGIGQLRATRLTATLAARAATIARLLSSADWQDPLPGGEVDRIQATVAAIGRTRARSALRKICDSLVAAHEAGDVAAARSLCDRWDVLEAEARPDDDDDEFTAARDARNWVADHDARQQRLRDAEAAAAAIRGVCDAGVPFSPGAALALHSQIRASLASLHDTAYEPESAAAFADVTAVARRRMAQLARVPVRFWTIASVATGLAVATTAWGVGIVVDRTSKSRVLAAVRRDCLEDDMSLADATRAWNTHTERHGWLHDHAIAAEVETSIERLKGNEQTAWKSLDQTVAIVKKTLDGVPDRLNAYAGEKAELDEARKALKDARADVDRLQDDVDDFSKRHPGRDVGGIKETITSLGRRLEEYDEDLDERVDTFSDQRASKIEKEVVRLETAPAGQVRQDDVRRIRESVDAFADSFPRAAKPWGERLKSVETRIRDHAKLEDVRRQLDRAAGKGVDEYARKVADLAAGELPGPATALPDVVAADAAVKAAIVWAEVANVWEANSVFDPAAGVHASWSDAITKALDTIPRPDGCTDAVRGALERLVEKLGDHKRDHDERLARLERELSWPVMDPGVLEFVPRDGDAAFYTTDANQRKGRFFRNPEQCDKWSKDLQDATLRQLEPARHIGFGRKAMDVIERIQRSKTDIDVGLDSLLGLFPESSPSAQGVDVLLRCKLLLVLIDAMQDRPAFAGAPGDLAKLRDAITDKVGDKLLWVDPETRNPDTVRQAKRILADDERFTKIRDGFRKWRNELVARPSCCRKLTFLGWIDREGDAFRVRGGGDEKAANGDRLVVVVAEGKDDYRIVTVGRMKGEEAGITDSNAVHFGQPIFVEPRN